MSLKRIIALTLVIIVVLALAYPKLSPLLEAESKDVGSRSNAPLKVDVSVVEPRSVKHTIKTSGTVIANEEVELKSETSGKVTKITFDEGSKVSKNQLLLKTNDSELQAQLKKTKYQLSLAEEREDRQKQLLTKGGISQEAYDATLNQVNVLKAELDLIKARIEKTEIRAPFDGVIGLKYVSVGSYINPESRIASLKDVVPVKIDFSIPERYTSQISTGKRIEFSVQGTNNVFNGEIYAIEPEIDPGTRTLQLRALSPNTSGQLYPGAFADIEIIMEEMQGALMIPTIALVPEIDGQKVWIYRGGQVLPEPVQTGIRTENDIQITEGIQPGDTVLTTGLLQVRPGMTVDIKSTSL